MVAYKEWGFQLYPGVAFEDLASRTEKLGGKARTRDLMHELRDTERDRVVEAKFGRAAVDDIRAQEAAKLVARESKTAAAEEEAAEERQDKELAGSRYMEVDGEEGGASPSTGGGGAGGGADAARNSRESAAVLSEQVRQRMEMNRRLALERLRLKKEEAAAAAAALGDGVDEAAAGAVAMAVGEDGGMGGPKDGMDVDADGEAEGDDDFEDDEAALAEIEAEHALVSKTEPAASAGTTSQAADAGGAPSPTAVQSDKTPAPVAPVGDTATHLVDTAQERTIGENDASGAAGSVVDDVSLAPASTVNDRTHGAPLNDATVASADATSALREPAASGSRVEEKNEGRAEDEGENASRSARGVGVAATAEVAAASVGATPAVGEGAGAPEPSAVTKGGEQETFSSPTKRKPASGLPLSPLGNMFASTDVPAEGGSAAVRAPLGGLFSDENI